jgi:hypothetical protein
MFVLYIFFQNFGSSLQISLGSSHINFWLFYTLKVLNILFLQNFSFRLVNCMYRLFFKDFSSSLQILSDCFHTNVWLPLTFEELNILFFKENPSDRSHMNFCCFLLLRYYNIILFWRSSGVPM